MSSCSSLSHLRSASTPPKLLAFHYALAQSERPGLGPCQLARLSSRIEQGLGDGANAVAGPSRLPASNTLLCPPSGQQHPPSSQRRLRRDGNPRAIQYSKSRILDGPRSSNPRFQARFASTVAHHSSQRPSESHGEVQQDDGLSYLPPYSFTTAGEPLFRPDPLEPEPESVPASSTLATSDEMDITDSREPLSQPASPPRSYSTPHPDLINSLPPSSTDNLITFLSAESLPDFRAARSNLPRGLTKIDAYLALRERAPERLADLQDHQITWLFTFAGKEGLGGVLRLLIRDLLGDGYASNTTGHGYFHALPGTQRRLNGLRSLLLACSTGDLLQLGDETVTMFRFLTRELSAVEAASAAQTEPVEPDAVRIPNNFPAGEARRLVSTIVTLRSSELTTTLEALIQHLSKATDEFPTAREGSKLIAYFLLPDIQDHRSALNIVKLMRETNAIGEDAVIQAHKHGQSWLKHVSERLSIATGDARHAQLQRQSLELTLRIIGTTSMLSHRPEGRIQYRKSFEDLMALVGSLEGDRYGREPGSPTKIGLDVFRLLFAHLQGQSTQESMMHASMLLERCDRDVLACIEDHEVEEFCELAFSMSLPQLASTGFLTIVKAKSLAQRLRPFEAWTMVKSETFIKILRDRNRHGQFVMVKSVLQGLGVLPLTDEVAMSLDRTFQGNQRVELIKVLADAGLKEPALRLYQRWSRLEYKGQDLLSRPSPRVYEVHRQTRSRMLLGDPALAELYTQSTRHAASFEANPVASSSSCMISLVRMLCKNDTFKALERIDVSDPKEVMENNQRAERAIYDLNMARFVVEALKASRPLSSWTHYDLTALASAFFYLRDSRGAFDAFASIVKLRLMPDAMDLSVLFGGLVHTDAEKAVKMFIHITTNRDADASSSPWQSEERMSDDDSLNLPHIDSRSRLMGPVISTLLSRCLTTGRQDLAETLIGHIEAQGLTNRVDLQRYKGLLFRNTTYPPEIAKRLRNLVSHGWRPDAGLLDYVARESLYSPKVCFDSRQIAEASRNRKHGAASIRASLAAGMQMIDLSFRELGVVNLKTVDTLLRKLERLADGIFPPEKVADASGKPVDSRKSNKWHPEGQDRVAGQWIRRLDRLVYALRWTAFFDTGSNARQGLPFSRSSGSADGKLVPIGLDDSIDASRLAAERGGKHGRSSMVKAASPNVLPLKMFRSLIEVYLRLRDYSGAAEVAAWMRDEAGADVARTKEEEDEFVSRVVRLLDERRYGLDEDGREVGTRPGPVLEMLAGQRQVNRTKMWWISSN